MIVIDERYKIEGVAERWKAQYYRCGAWGSTITGDCGVIYEKLAALNPETATGKDVAKIIGNNSWAGPDNCNECGNEVERTVQLGEPPDYKSRTAQICLECLRKAVQLLESARANSEK